MKLTGRELDKMMNNEDDFDEDDVKITSVTSQIEKMRTAAGKSRKEEDRAYSTPDAKRFHKKNN